MDIQTAVAFLSMSVKCPDEDTWEKLKRMMKYMNRTRNLKLTLLADNLGIIHWFVYAPRAIYDDFKGYVG